jgi:hypothetical protein
VSQSTRSHPALYQLETYAAGDRVPATVQHLADCDACKAQVEQLAAMYETLPAEDFLAKIDARAKTADDAAVDNVVVGPWRARAAWVAGVGALAAGTYLFVGHTAPARQPTVVTEEGVRFKGERLQLALVRERSGAQERLTKTVRVKAGDRVRAELVLERPGAVTVVLLRDDGKTWPMLAPTELKPGVNYSPEAIRFDAERFVGYVVAGDPESVELALSKQDFAKVQRVRVESE